MKLLFKQRFFSWFDSYDIFDESGITLFTVEGQLAWGHTLHINDIDGNRYEIPDIEALDRASYRKIELFL